MTNTVFLEEVRKKFERTIDIKEKLDSKTNNIITLSGTIATLTTGFGTFIITNTNDLNNYFLIPAIVVLLAEIIFCTITLNYSIDSYKLKEYSYPLDPDDYVLKSGESDKKKINEFINADQDEISSEFVSSYVDCTIDNERINIEKTQYIQKAQTAIIWTVALFPAFSLLMVLANYVS